MGTNYYVRIPGCENDCGHCGEANLVHLGKSSAGWKFGFEADPSWPREEALDRWMDRAKAHPIEDEYGQYIELTDLLGLIMSKQGGRSHTVDHGVSISGPYFNMFKDSNFDCKGFDFSDREFS